MYCENCGKQMNAAAIFCQSCGAKRELSELPVSESEDSETSTGPHKLQTGESATEGDDEDEYESEQRAKLVSVILIILGAFFCGFGLVLVTSFAYQLNSAFGQSSGRFLLLIFAAGALLLLLGIGGLILRPKEE